MPVVVPVACRAAGVDAPQKRGRQCQSSAARDVEGAFLRGTLRSFSSLGNVMTVPERSTIMYSGPPCERRYTSMYPLSILRRDITARNEKSFRGIEINATICCLVNDAQKTARLIIINKAGRIDRFANYSRRGERGKVIARSNHAFLLNFRNSCRDGIEAKRREDDTRVKMQRQN